MCRDYASQLLQVIALGQYATAHQSPLFCTTLNSVHMLRRATKPLVAWTKFRAHLQAFATYVGSDASRRRAKSRLIVTLLSSPRKARDRNFGDFSEGFERRPHQNDGDSYVKADSAMQLCEVSP